MENILAMVCDRCGVAVLSKASAENIRRLVYIEENMLRSVRMDVFAYSLEGCM
ncbi:MAG: hypothetical protein JW908_17215 [Anaerolineales bacterium]|nr:hypothetical protein [Anaerolineales bacterium]